MPLTSRAIARITGLTHSTAQRALTRLCDADLVVAEPAPPSRLYHTNPEHLAMPAILAWRHLNDELRACFTEHVAGWRAPPEAAVIYGSMARGEAQKRSLRC
jgi:MarR family